MRKSKIVAAIIGASVLLTQVYANASDTSSSIRGQVVDASGSVLSNVVVEVVHQPTGKIKTVTTTEGGIFQLRGLPVGGPYSVRISGGTTLKFNNINDLFLQLGQASKISLIEEQQIERIQVSGKLAMAGTYSKGPSKEFGESDIANTAAISRDLKSILKRDSRMMVDPTADGGPALSIAGGNVRGNSLTVDGVKQNDDFGLNKNGYPGRRTPISLDAIAQLSVNIAPFEVTYGDFSGGSINIVTKSGTNEFHGSAFYYRADDSMIGDKSEGVDLSIGDFSEDSYGFTLGGPIIEDKLFFFASYEKFNATKPYQFSLDNENGTVEPNEKIGVTQADFDRISHIAKSVYNYDIGGYDTTADEKDEKLLLKFDWYVSDDHRASFTFQDNSGNTVRDFWGESFPNASWATAESNRYNMSESLRAYSFQVFSDWTDDFSTEFKFARKEVNTQQVSLSSERFAQMLIQTGTGASVYIGPDQFRHANELENNRDMFKLKADYNLTDEHLLTFGVEHERLEIYNLFVFGSFGWAEYGSIEDFEAQSPGILLYQNADSNNPRDAADIFEYSTTTFYAQDEWSYNDDLTLTIGFRYTNYSNDDKPVLNDNFVARHGYDNQNNYDGLELFEPRFGFNYTYDDDTVIRGGIGLFGGGAPNVWLSNSYGNDGVRKQVQFYGNWFADISGFNGKEMLPSILDDATLANNSDTNSIDPDFEIPSVWKTNLGIERRQDLGFLGDDWLLSLDLLYTVVENAALYKEMNMTPTDIAPDGRPIYSSPGPFDLNLTNTQKGEGQVWSFAADKNFYTDHGNYTVGFSYSYQDITEVNPGNSFVAFEGYSMPANSNFQSEKVYNSEFEVRHTISAHLAWSDELFGNNLTVVSLQYNGRDGRHFSHTMRSAGTFGGFAGFASWDGYNSQLLYIPRSEDDPTVTYGEDFDKAGFFSYINSDDCLKGGEISRRHACTSSWINRLNLHISQEITISGDKKLEITFDIENLGNLLNDDWGRAESFVQPFNAPVVDVTIENGAYVYNNFTKPTQTVAKIPSVWKAQLGLRYRF